MKRDRICTYHSIIVLIICSSHALYSSENSISLNIPQKETIGSSYNLSDEIKRLEPLTAEEIELYLTFIKTAHNRVRESVQNISSKDGENSLKQRENAIRTLLYRKKHPVINFLKRWSTAYVLPAVGCAIITYACWKIYHCYTTTNTSEE